eukprot:TRINITY_DN10135_c0_g1_i3.p1 TRINITY_DN10135_c0_g1~~TRINITY_DN10135_c0_g1_i3.p1  ORF type:complete len:158 (+),score=23.00 TRINITY_DN10135_c0_g1_i3:94-567(+)
MTSCDICGSYCDHSTPHCPSLRCPTLPAAIKMAVASSEVGAEVVTKTTSKPVSDLFAEFVSSGASIEIPKIPDNPVTVPKEDILKPDWLVCGVCNTPGHLMCNGRSVDSTDKKLPWNVNKIQCTKCLQSTHVTSQCGIRGSRLFGISQQNVSNGIVL